MNNPLVLLDAVVVGLALVLLTVILSAVREYRDTRFLFVGVAVSVIAAMGLGALLAQFFPSLSPDTGMTPLNAILLLASEIFLYLSLSVPRHWTSTPEPAEYEVN